MKLNRKSTAAKPGIIRPGQKRPFKKSTREEVDRRVEVVAQYLVQRKTRFEIHDLVCKKWDITWSVVDSTYIPYARKLLAKQSSKTVEQARLDGIAVLEDVLKTGNNRERIAAEDRLAEIFGYNAARRTEISGSLAVEDERPFEKVSTERLRQLIAAPVEPASKS